MSSSLNIGAGRCQGTAFLLIKPKKAVIQLGADEDVLVKTLKTVHHANRNGSAMDFIAVAFPAMHLGRNCMLPGYEIVLIGSNFCLSSLLEQDEMKKLNRRGMLVPMDITETFMSAGETGAAYVRDRACEKWTSGWIRRSASRAQRRAKPVGKVVNKRDYNLSTLALRYGNIVLNVREIAGEIRDVPLMVNTFGFSSQNSPAILPVLPDSIRRANEAI